MPTPAVPKLATGDPSTIKVSPFTRPTYSSVPLIVALVRPSYTLLFAVIPVIVNVLAVIVSVAHVRAALLHPVVVFLACA